MAMRNATAEQIENDEEPEVKVDPLAVNRTLPVVAKSAVPSVPKGFQTLKDGVSRTLRRFPDTDRAEGVNALKQLAEQLRHDPTVLGDLAPKPALAEALAQRIDAAHDTITALEALLAYHRAIQDIAEHDAWALLTDAEEEIERRVRKGVVASSDFEKVSNFVAAKGAAIAEGIARARVARAARKDSEGKKANDNE